MKNKPVKQDLEAYFKETVENFEEYFNDPDQHEKIFSELGFELVEDGCDGFCPECDQRMECEDYEEIRGEWEIVCPSTVH